MITKEYFKVGDKIIDERMRHMGEATVTEITERGFKYELDKTFNAHPRMGISWDGGEAYLDDEFLQKTCSWRKVNNTSVI